MSPETPAPLPQLIARFRPQAEINGYCVDIDGAFEFDATPALLRLSLEELREFRQHSDTSDRLAEADTFDNVHTGPFEVDCDGLDAFFAAHGLSRTALTLEQLETLRAVYKIGQETQPLGPWDEFDSLITPGPWSLIYVRTGTITVAGPCDTEEDAYELAKGLQARGDFDIREQEVVLIDGQHDIREIYIADLDLDDEGRPRSIPENQPCPSLSPPSQPS